MSMMLRLEAHLTKEGEGYIPIPSKVEMLSLHCQRKWKWHSHSIQDEIGSPSHLRGWMLHAHPI
jgi:hypothetical protein